MKQRNQLDLAMACPTGGSHRLIRTRRHRDAKWWFSQMRLMVERVPGCASENQSTVADRQMELRAKAPQPAK